MVVDFPSARILHPVWQFQKCRFVSLLLGNNLHCRTQSHSTHEYHWIRNYRLRPNQLTCQLGSSSLFCFYKYRASTQHRLSPRLFLFNFHFVFCINHLCLSECSCFAFHFCPRLKRKEVCCFRPLQNLRHHPHHPHRLYSTPLSRFT